MYVCVLENHFFPSTLKAPLTSVGSRLYDISTKENVRPGTIISFENILLGQFF